MATPADSPHMQLNIDTRSSLSHSNTDNNRDHSSKDGSYQSPQTPVSEYSHSNQQHQPSPYRGSPKKHQSNNSSNNNKRIYLDITGQFPYNEEEKKEKKEKNNNNNHHNTTHKSHKRKSRKKEEFEIRELSKEEISALEKETLSLHGYERSKFIATTLQGEVFLAKKKDGSNKEVVVKKTSKKLHKLGITITKTGKRIKVQENIVAEAELMQTFMRNQPPSSLIEYYDFFQDGFYFYLVMENGGSDYFDFIVKCHELISSGKLTLSEWRKHCKFMFAQMIQFIRWMHQTMHCCNLDISLENMLIRDCAYYDEESKTLKKCYIKFIDFGLCEFFDLKTNPKFLCQKYVGKTHYKAPKVYGKKEIFQANKADIWSLGVSLFMMIIGAPPYNKPIDKDITFQYIKYKQIAKLLQEWGRIKYVTSNLHDLLTKMLTFDEDKRITLDEIVKHPWIKHYFPNENAPKPVQPPPPQPSVQQPQQPPKLPPKLSIGSIVGGSSSRDIPPSPSYSKSNTKSANNNSHNNNNNGYRINNGMNPQLNIMIPNQAVSSMSGSVYHTPSASRTSRGSQGSIGSYNGNRKYSQPYSPIIPHSPHSQQHNNGLNNGVTTPTPIIQSYTSKHDTSIYLAATDHENGPRRSYSDVDKHSSKNIKYKHKSKNGHKSRKKAHSDVTSDDNIDVDNYKDKDKSKRKNRRRKKSSGKKDKKKKSKKFFKLNLPLFGGN